MSVQAFRWAQNLGLRDLAALILVGPLLGWWLMVGSLWPPGHGGLDRQGIRGHLMDHSCAGGLGGLIAIGAALGLLSPRLRGFGAATVMVPVVVFVINDFWADGQNHNLFGVELLMYGAFTGIAVAAGFGASALLARLRAPSLT
jgi:hypothetical protein